MDKYDKDKRVALVVDEWGTWYDVEPGTNPGFLYQQNTLRDALTSGLTLNIFNNHADRVKMANIAQTVNVLQAVILTNETSLVLTPTYHVFDLYKPHKEAKMLPYSLNGPDYKQEDESLSALSVSCSRSDNGTVNITLVNIDPAHAMDLETMLPGLDAKKVTGKIITSDQINDRNTFEETSKVVISAFDDTKISKGKIVAKIPAKSVVLLQVTE
jgi:alpha-N-arabinofuranosidase